MIEGLALPFLILFLIEKVAIAQNVTHNIRAPITISIIAAEDRLGGGVDELTGFGTLESVSFGT